MSEKEKKEPVEIHPSQSTSSAWHDDQVLRSYGYKIHSRRKDREAVWEKDGELVSHSDALQEVRSKRKSG